MPNKSSDNRCFDVYVSDDRGNRELIDDSDHLVLWVLGRTGIKIETRWTEPFTPYTPTAPA